MRSFWILPAAALLLAAPCLAQPVIAAVVNNYSLVRSGLPNYGIAQGSIFAIYGNNFGTVSSPLQVAPLKTVLSGISVQIQGSGAAVQAFLYYVTPTQIGGVLPSATPVGNGQITVTIGSQTSAPAPITVVQSAFGILTDVLGVASAFDGNWKRLSQSNAANPGDVVVLYGTGAGPISGDDSQAPASENLFAIPIAVDVGGIPASVQYHGRSGYPGLDQINVVIPAGVFGCNVSVAIVSAGLVSNVAFIPVAAQGRTCTDQYPGVNLIPTLYLTPSVIHNIGTIAIQRFVRIPSPAPFGPPPTATVSGDVGFTRTIYSEPTPTGVGGQGVFPSIGSCSTGAAFLPAAALTEHQGPAKEALTAFTLLDAGPSMHFSNPSGTVASIPRVANGSYSGTLAESSGLTSTFLPTAGGVVKIDNGAGGSDVGAFSAQMSTAPPIVWTNLMAIPSVIDSTQDLTLKWTGGNPSGVVAITANSSTAYSGGTISGAVYCHAPVSAGQFTIPSSALLSLPESSTEGSLLFVTADQSSFSAPGMDAGIILLVIADDLSVKYK